jgi:hypothetical protein
MYVRKKKNDCDKQNNEQLHDALEHGKEEHYNQNHTDGEIQ